MLTAEHAKARQAVVTATDTYRLCGLGYGDEHGDSGRAAMNIFTEKVASEPIVRPANERMILGSALEPEIKRRWEDRNGLRLVAPETPVLVGANGNQFQGASPDWFAGGPLRVVDGKAVFSAPGDDWGDEGTDAVPERLIVQMQKQMLVANVRRAELAVLFVPHCFRIYVVEYDAALCNLLTQIDKAFWRFVEEREPPPHDWKHPFAATVREAVQHINPLEKIALTDTESILAQEYHDLRDVARQAEERAEEMKDGIIRAMGTAAVGILPGGGTVRRGVVKRKAYSVPESTYTSFRISHPKLKALSSHE